MARRLSHNESCLTDIFIKLRTKVGQDHLHHKGLNVYIQDVLTMRAVSLAYSSNSGPKLAKTIFFIRVSMYIFRMLADFTSKQFMALMIR